jgi:putative membrane protein
MLLRPEPTLREVRLLQWCDRWYGMFAGIVLGAGLFRVLYYAKGTAFYMSNPFFHLKITLCDHRPDFHLPDHHFPALE